jgi:hypothetical protein
MGHHVFCDLFRGIFGVGEAGLLGVKHSRKRDSKFAERFSTTCALIVQWNRQQRHASSLGISVDRSVGYLPHSRVNWRLFNTKKNCYASRCLPKSLVKRCHQLINLLTCAVFSCIRILAAKRPSMEKQLISAILTFAQYATIRKCHARCWLVTTFTHEHFHTIVKSRKVIPSHKMQV